MAGAGRCRRREGVAGLWRRRFSPQPLLPWGGAESGQKWGWGRGHGAGGGVEGAVAGGIAGSACQSGVKQGAQLCREEAGRQKKPRRRGWAGCEPAAAAAGPCCARGASARRRRSVPSAHSMPSMCGSIPARLSTRCQHCRFTSSVLGMGLETPMRGGAVGCHVGSHAAGSHARDSGTGKGRGEGGGGRGRGRRRFGGEERRSSKGRVVRQRNEQRVATARMLKLRSRRAITSVAAATAAGLTPQAVHDDGLAGGHGQPGALPQLRLQAGRAARQQGEPGMSGAARRGPGSQGCPSGQPPPASPCSPVSAGHSTPHQPM